MAVIAVDTAPGCPAGKTPIVVGRIRKRDRWRMAGGADTGPIGILGKKVPPHAGLALPIAAFVEVQEVAIGRGTRMAARRPFAVDFLVAVAAILPSGRIGRRIDPGIGLIVFLRK